ncbi:tetratricopeptide repeat protein [Lutimonas vermicola]|uniref:Tetratricopeptide repeat protein n=1 Tax=Lutimonas vermicola TaxID=414288 RepID=A0ABU9L2D3_9FLAO
MKPFQQNRNIAIAILPFQVMTKEERIKNLFFGFTEDLMTSFSKFIGLSVISSYSTLQIKDVTNQSEIDQLAADYLVFGSVRHINDTLRISIQLVNSKDKSLVFGEQYNETIYSLLDAQDTVVQQIVSVLQEKINYNLLSHSYKKNAVDLAAYENYLIGMSILKKGSGDNDKKSRDYFNAALKIDPNYSLAYTGLSLSYFNFWSCLLWDRWDKSMKGAHTYALKAIELDPNDYTALGVLGRTYVYRGDYEQAEHCLRKSLRMNSNDASNLLRVSFSLMYLGYADEAVKLYLRAIKINPFHKDVYFAYGSNYYLEVGDFEKSIALSKKVPFNCWTDFPAWVAAAYLQVEDFNHLWKCWNIFLNQFENKAYTGKETLEKEAIDWLIILNPFKGKNYLSPLFDFIRSHKNIENPVEQKPLQRSNSSFLLKGDVWVLNYKHKSITLKDAKGYRDIHKLISQPFYEFHCLDLMESAVDESISTESIDAKAKAQYISRIKELQEDIDEAEEMNQSEKIALLRHEYDTILDYLSQTLGLAGKTRKVGSTVEKARSAVTWRIRNAIKKIENNHPELGNHLSKSIKTGTLCAYNPELTVHWIL